MRAGAAFRAIFLTGAALALILILAFAIGERLTTLAFALAAVLDPTVFLATFATDVPNGDGLVSAYEVVVARASPTTTPAVVTRILTSQRAAAPTRRRFDHRRAAQILPRDLERRCTNVT